MDRILKGSSLLALFILNVLLVGVNFTPFGGSPQTLAQGERQDQTIDSTLPKDVLDQSTPSTPRAASGSAESSWWNETFQYRQQINLTESGVGDRTNEPVDVYLTFAADSHHVNSTRVARYDGGTAWTEIPCQVWNASKTSDHVNSATITFMASVLAGTTSQDYYVYYNGDDTGNATYATNLNSERIMQDAPDEDQIKSLRVENGQFVTTFNTTMGIATLEASGRNYHTNNSLSPGPGLTISDGLVGYWNFEEGSGTTVNDVTGKGHTGTIVGTGATWVEGKLGRALSLTSSSYVSVPDAPDLRLGKYMTISVWIKPTQPPGDWARIVGKGDGTYRNYGIWHTSSRGILWQVYSSGGSGNINMVGTVGDGAWSLVTVTYNATHMAVYKNGTWSAAVAYTQTPYTSTHPLTFGDAFHSYFRGAIDEIRIYDRSLTPAEIYTLYQDTGRAAIDKIEVAYEGPVFTQVRLQWSKTGNMTTWDNVTIYNNLNHYAVERRYYWENHRTTANNSWEALNTLYPNDWIVKDGTYSNYHYDDSDNNPQHGWTTPITAHNYTAIRGLDLPGYVPITLGVFLTKSALGPGNLKYSWLEWKSTNTGSRFEFMPGNRTDLDNTQSPIPVAGSYYLNLTFWEYLRVNDGFANDHAAASTDLSLTFRKLKGPITASVGAEESRFFNVGVKVFDIDGNPVPMANASLYNVTNEGILDQYITSGFTGADGVLNLTRLVTYNYTLNVTYGQGAFTSFTYNGSKSLDLASTNFTLNQSTCNYQTSKFFEFPVNMTSKKLTFVQYKTGQEMGGSPLGGARISFHEVYPGMTPGEGNPIGNLTADASGVVTLHWQNFTEGGEGVETNITFDCYFLDDFRPINITGTWEQNESIWFRNATPAGYTVLTNIKDFSSNLEVISSSLDGTQYWGSQLTTQVRYTYTEQGGATSSPISGATVTYQLSSSSRGVFNASSFVETGPSGTYQFSFGSDAAWLDLKAGTNYLMTVTAAKAGFSTIVAYVSINLLNITTSATPDASEISVYWQENATIRVYYRDTLHTSAITGAQLSYQVPTRPSIAGPLTEEGAGWYKLVLNSTTFPFVDTYSLLVTASKDNFAQASTSVTLRILKIRTYIGTWLNTTKQSITVQEVVAVNVTTDLAMYFNYTTASGAGIPDAAVKEYEWEAPNGLKGTGYLADAGNGIYTLNFSTATKPIGRYSLVVTLGQTNYIERVATITLDIVAKPIVLNPVGFAKGGELRKPQGEDIIVVVDLADLVANAPLAGATVEISLDNGTTWLPFTPDAQTPGRYSISISTASYNALFAQINVPARIRVTKGNYTQGESEFLFTIAVAPPEIAGIPTIYWIIAIVAAAIVIGGFVAVKSVQKARIPQVIKDITQTRADIRKGRVIDVVELSKTKAEVTHGLISGPWAAIGLPLEAPKKASAEPARDPVTELQRSKEASE